MDEIERVSTRWPAYEALLTERITPLLCDLVDAVGPLLRSGLRAVPASASAHHFELFACDLVFDAASVARLMEVNINPAFGAFAPATRDALVRPLFADLLALVVLPHATGAPPARGHWRRIGCDADADAAPPPPPPPPSVENELRAHFAYVTFKRSHRKRYEKKVGAERPIHLTRAVGARSRVDLATA